VHRYGSRRRLGDYEIYDDDALGRGGNGIVFLGHHPRLGRPVAFKRIELDVPAAAVERFVSEAQLAGSLTHPSIVFVFDVFEDDGVPYIAMEYVERGALRKWMPLRREQAFIAIEGMLSALAYAHRNGIVHRDVKPENLLVTDAGTVKLTDFGLASGLAVATDKIAGTPGYMAPEVLAGERAGPRADLYAAGAVAYELLTGRPVVDAKDASVFARRANEPITTPAGLDPEVSAWLDRMLAPRPEDRPQSAEAAWEQLEGAVARLHGALWRREGQRGWVFSPNAQQQTTAITEVTSRESVVYSTPLRWRRRLTLGAAALVAIAVLMRIVRARAHRNSAS
jgi:serine/threonine-protein kinase